MNNTKKIAGKLLDDHIDDHVDETIKKCFSKNNPKSFFMFAGAGSGKTRSLVNTLLFLDKVEGEKLSTTGKKVAIITYTNVACDEISRRLQYKPIFAVSTIHSFLWEQIKNFQLDIKDWIIQTLKADIAELEEKQRNGRGGRAAENRQQQIEKKESRLEKIYSVNHFSYNPNGENTGSNSLNHSEVIKMGSEFIAKEETMQEILIAKYPYLLIDESQDTKKELIDALLIVQDKYKHQFVVGMFGDMLQRIYLDGKDNLENCIPDDWEKPMKVMNHRSAKRIVCLANSVRSTIDNQKQQSRSDAELGIVRLFIAHSSSEKDTTENKIAQMMVIETKDSGWTKNAHKTLILEHHMAASRFGFLSLYEPLNASNLFDTSLRDGSISEFLFLANVISPLVKAYQDDNHFEISKIIRKESPLLDKNLFLTTVSDQANLIEKAETSVDLLMKLWADGNIPSCLDVLRSIQGSGLFKLSQRVTDILSEPVDGEDAKVTALRASLKVLFTEMERYMEYVTDKTRFATHQGVKGLEFPHVMVIMDDNEARGFLFSYEKLFGAKEKTDTDKRNEQEGKDTSILRTTRLFYVACTRAEKSLAVVAYTDDVEKVKETALANNWFKVEEIMILEDD